MSAKTAKASARASPPPSPTTAKEVASLQVSLPQMLDLALGTPEVGAVNFNILHNFLHILLHQISLQSTKVEYRGEDANRIKTMVNSLKAGPTLYLQEYNIVGEAGGVEQTVRPGETINVEVDVVIEESPAQEASEAGADTIKTKGSRQKIGPGTEGGRETVIYVEPIVDGATPSALGFKRLEHTVHELQQRFQALEELATTPELIERLKGKITDPVSDVWQVINITKRLDASEQGIDKLTKMVQDVIKGDATVTVDDTSPMSERLTNLENAVNNLDQIVRNLQIFASGEESLEIEGLGQEPADEEKGEEAPHSTQQRISLTQLLGGIDIKEMYNDVATLKVDVSKMRDEMKQLDGKIAKAKTELVQKVESSVELQKMHKAEPKAEPKAEAKPAEADDEEPKADETQEDVTTPKEGKSKEKVESPKSPVTAKQAEQIDTDLEELDSEELGGIRERISKLEKDVSCLFEKVESAPMAGVAGSADIEDLVGKINEIQAEMEKLNQTADRLIDDRENREMHLNALLEQVELLKTIKADREDLEDALAEKADAHAINRKVSYDQFDAACDDLAQGLEDAIGKLGQQEAIWQQALDEVQKEIEGKVDKMEMSPLKDFVNHRLKSLQEKLKAISEARQELEAAGTKKLLRDVQCISCDKDVVMRMDPDRRFKMDGLPCSLSMKPYLTYELDQVRKQRRRLPHSRNMLQFEAAMQEETRKQRSAREPLDKTPRDHLCNRYCGGSHTVTTPQQRVMRVGHFLTQWGPEIVQLTEGMIKGTDGKMYKGRRMLEKIDVCGPSYCSDHGDEIRSMERPSTTATVGSRKSSERQASINGKKRPTRRRSRELSKEVIEEVSEAPVEETDQESDVPTDTGGPPGHIPRYIDEEELGEQD